MRIFISYAREDLPHLETLRRFGARLTAGGTVEIFDDRDVEAGQRWNERLIGELNRADVVVLLLTAHFVASGFCMDTELPLAIRRQEQGLCVIIPLYVAPFVVAPADELAQLQWYPSGRPITGRGARTDEAWAAAVREIQRKVETRPDTTPAAGRPPRVTFTERLVDAWWGGADRRLAAAGRALDRALSGDGRTPPGEPAAQVYGRCVRLALRVRPETARNWADRYDARIPEAVYPAAFGPADHDRLAAVAATGDRHHAETALVIAVRLRFADVQQAARDRLLPVLALDPNPTVLVRWLGRLGDLGLLTPEVVRATVTAYVTHTPLQRNRPLWTEFLGALPQRLLPAVFDVHHLLGRIVTAAPLADTPERVAVVLRAARASDGRDDVEAALRLPRHPGQDDLVRAVEERAGDLHAAAHRYAEAAGHYRAAGRTDRASECDEMLGRFADALESCPADRPDRIARLVDRCLPEVHELAGQEAWTQAATRLGVLMAHLGRATGGTDGISAARDILERRRSVLLTQGRQRFGDRVRAGDDTAAERHYREWSAFEEAAGEHARAAGLAEAAGDLMRAYDLYFRASQYGDADRVLNTDPSADATVRRARAREAGGDLLGAARHYRTAGEWDRAAELFERLGQFDAAARCLTAHYRADALDARLIRVLRGAGDLAELVRRSVAGAGGGDGPAVDELRRLAADRSLEATLRSAVDRAVDSLDGRARRAFEARVQSWIAQARRETDERFATVWGLDLGTSTCVVAIYDSVRREPVLCGWKDNPGHFAATVSVDRQGHELIGLTGDQLSTDQIVTEIHRAKRDMGTDRTWDLGNGTTFRPEEVAARLVRYARRRVEAMLAHRVRERVTELARAELGRVDEAWLDQHHDVRLDRPRAVVTIPAYFPMTAKNATRDACRIAGVDLVRLIHEPTAACLAAAGAPDRPLQGSVLVVDLGAGTLDISLMEIHDDLYTVREVFGDNRYGAGDFDDLIAQALIRRLERHGIVVGEDGDRRRLAVAAEKLKVDLSAAPEARHRLVDFHGREVVLTLTRDELVGILRDSLATLRRVCVSVRDRVPDGFGHLVLVGGPMFSPVVRGTVERAFGRRGTKIRNPRSAVALGAALQGAVIDGTVRRVLLDVTPFALGIEARRDGRTVFAEVVPRSATIPTRFSEIFSTEVDNQRNVSVQVYNGELDPDLLIGRFVLPDLPPAPRGLPKIEVTFDIDVSCVLTVTARDLATGTVRSIRITDTTLLAPADVKRMTARHEAVVHAAALRADLEARVADLRDRVAEATEMLAESGQTGAEFERRRSAHRPGAHPLDADVQKALVEMHGPQAGLELVAATQIVRDVTGWAREYLTRADDASVETVAEAQLLAGKMSAHLTRLGTEMTRVGGWVRLLKDLAAQEPDPVRRFRTHHDAGEYQRALDAVGGIAEPLRERADLDRYLRCLAEVGEFDRYREVLAAHAGQLGLRVLDPDRPEEFLATVADDLVTVDGRCTGFRTGSLAVGHAASVRIGARVWAVTGAGELRPGLVDGLDPGPGGGYRFRAGITAAAPGGPLFDDLGLVIGVLVDVTPTGSVAASLP